MLTQHNTVTIKEGKCERDKEALARAASLGCTVTKAYLFPNPDGKGRTLFVRQLAPWSPQIRKEIMAKLGLSDIPDDHLAKLGLLPEDYA